MQSKYLLKIKRIYENPVPEDGIRILIDRMWPRGVTKERAHLDRWAGEVAPSISLRKWFSHDPEKYEVFSEKYRAELLKNAAAGELADYIEKCLQKQDVTLLYGAKDKIHNQALVYRRWCLESWQQK